MSVPIGVRRLKHWTLATNPRNVSVRYAPSSNTLECSAPFQHTRRTRAPYIVGIQTGIRQYAMTQARCVCASHDAASWRKPHRRAGPGPSMTAAAPAPRAELPAHARPSLPVEVARAIALAASGDAAEARRQLTIIGRRQPGAWSSNAHYLIGALCAAVDEHEQAEAHY